MFKGLSAIIQPGLKYVAAAHLLGASPRALETVNSFAGVNPTDHGLDLTNDRYESAQRPVFDANSTEQFPPWWFFVPGTVGIGIWLAGGMSAWRRHSVVLRLKDGTYNYCDANTGLKIRFSSAITETTLRQTLSLDFSVAKDPEGLGNVLQSILPVSAQSQLNLVKENRGSYTTIEVSINSTPMACHLTLVAAGPNVQQIFYIHHLINEPRILFDRWNSILSQHLPHHVLKAAF